MENKIKIFQRTLEKKERKEETEAYDIELKGVDKKREDEIRKRNIHE